MDTAYKTTLELDKVLNRAVQLCACQETKEMMQALEPAPTIEDERYDLTQTNAINALLIKNGSPRFGSVREVRRIVAHARKGGILSMGELLEIAATLRNFSGLSQWYGLSEHEMLPTDDLFFALAPQPVLEKQISESIISPEEMADTASVTLHDLRRKIRQTEDSIRTKLDNIIRNSTTNKFLQDAVVSLRNGRYVVPVRAEYRGEVGGVIHDVSSTGATVFVEPTAVVEANARIMQLRAQEQEEITRILTSFSNPLLGILVGIAFTSILQSASAAVGILQALSITGAITFEIAFPIIMGVAIGAAVPVLLSALGANLNGKRTAFIYLLIDVLGVLIWALLFYGANAIIHFTFLDTVMSSVSIALMNTLFRLATVIVLLPCIGLMEHMVELLFPDDGSAAEEQEMDRLEERFLQHPALSIEQSRLVTNSMAERAEGNLLMAVGLRNRWSDKDFRMVGETESVIDRYEDKLGTYLMKITSKSLSQSQSEEVSKYLHTISDFERISDHALNISEAAKEIHDKDLQFSPEACHELDVIESAVREILSIAVGAFVENDPQRAARVEPLEEIIDGLCDEMKSHHVDRLQSGSCTLNQGFVFNDLLTNYERVADHCSNIAVAIIELESDSFDTHEYLNSVRAMKSSSFARYYEEYKQEYHL